MRTFIAPLLLTLPALLLAGCMTQQGGSPSTAAANTQLLVKGSATYRERMALPADAVLVVRVEDVSRADAASTVLAETRVAPKGRQVPLPFTLAVPRAALGAKVSTSVSARIEGSDGRLWWITDSSHLLPAAHGAASVDIGELVMVRAGS